MAIPRPHFEMADSKEIPSALQPILRLMAKAIAFLKFQIQLLHERVNPPVLALGHVHKAGPHYQHVQPRLDARRGQCSEQRLDRACQSTRLAERI